ncbi:MAG TPA: CDP-alcohol phosphatidyltransferase family protein [candidate division Zixibacteria bacterium]|jgi:CDP-diacylglycerol--glycerol-3-phosphate 3-phosphatidyltransferase|nr:CDP-alcohol phosphatidyltransferase family protein [candidate division Zixibacteria bacterium]
MSPPNLLSLSRIAMMPFILLALRHGWDGVLLALMLLAVATDFLDGLLARRLGQVSDLGKILDPAADKVCIGSMVIALWLWRGFPWWAAALILFRDLMIIIGGLALIGRTKEVPASNLPGKWAAAAMAGAIVCYAMGWQPWGRVVLLASLFLAALSGAVYLGRFIKQHGARR